MTILGEFALWAALPIAAWGMVLGLAGGRTLRGDMVLSAERSIYGVTFLLTLASAGVMASFLGDRFEYWYVSSYSNAELEISNAAGEVVRTLTGTTEPVTRALIAHLMVDWCR